MPAMQRTVSSTIDNAGVRFIREGFDTAYPFVLGASGFAGLSGGLIAYKAIGSHPVTPEVNPTKQSVASVDYPENFANQAEGAAVIFAGTLLSVLAVSAVTASLLRAKRAFVKNSPTA